MSRSPCAERGFTLIEVLAAMAILAVSLAIAYRLLGDGLAGAGRIEDQSAALAVAEARLAELDAGGLLRPGVSTGSDAGLTWSVIIEPRADGLFARAAARGLAAVRVTVEVSGGNASPLRLATTRLVPAAP